MEQQWRLETRAVQGEYHPESGQPRVLPIAQSTTFKYETVDQAAELFDLEAEGHMYSRISNPTVELFEKKIAALEGGVGALACSSGQSASTLSILNICKAGEHVVSSSTIYGGTYNLFYHTFKKMGIEVTFIKADASAQEIKKAFRPDTKALFAESLENPGMNVLDFDKFGSIAREMDVPLIVDNTFPTPYYCNPFTLGAHIVVHSSTKYMDGHACCVGGVIVDGGNFNWRNGKYPDLVEPDPSYHGVSYVERFGNAAYITKARTQFMRDLGTAMSPMNAFLTNMGIETLHVRMDRHTANAQALAEHLEKHPKVGWVNYPGLKSSKSHELAKKYLRGCSGVLTFGIRGGVEEGIRFMNSLNLAAIVVHVADVRTCVLHPASMTHRQLNAKQQVEAGVSPDLIRVSVGIEHIDDIIADFDQALEKV
ncbi:MAG: O-acetylhomoserine aminocarboxypropyltransferase/cysteine synthase family protein [Chitinispirillaceae bacterium]